MLKAMTPGGLAPCGAPLTRRWRKVPASRSTICGVVDSAGTAPFPLRYRWTGREFDQESGLYFHRARYYSPAQARFIQEDPSGWSGGGNLYAYGDGNPVQGRDPNGMNKDYDMQPRPLHEQLPCMGTTQGCSSTTSYTAMLDYGAGIGASAFARMDREAAEQDVQDAVNSAQERGCASYDCPTVTEILNDPGVSEALAQLFRISNADSREMGFYITQGESGRLYTQPTVVGVVGEMRDVPPPPGNAVAWVHTHPDEGGNWGYPAQSGRDRNRWRGTQIHDIILSSRGIYVRSFDDRVHTIYPWR